MRVGLFALLQRGIRRMNRPLISVLITNFLRDEILHQRPPLGGVEFTRQGHFDFPIRRAVGAFVFVGSIPEMRGVMRRPLRHVAVGGRFQIFIAFAPAVFSLAGNIRGVRSGLAFAANLYGAVVRRHAVAFDFPRRGARFSQRNN